MQYDDQKLEVIQGAFTLRQALHPTMLARVPPAFDVDTPLTHYGRLRVV